MMNGERIFYRISHVISRYICVFGGSMFTLVVLFCLQGMTGNIPYFLSHAKEKFLLHLLIGPSASEEKITDKKWRAQVKGIGGGREENRRGKS